ncbi:MAG: TIGR00366 family protein [Myxococcota bacterium]
MDPNAPAGRAHIVQVGHLAASWSERFVPDPFVLAILLAGAVFVLGIAGQQLGPLDLVRSFASGMLAPPLLTFAFQMALILVTGQALAEAAPVRRGLRALAALPRTGPQAAATVAAGAMLLSTLNWGLGLVGGALLAREVGRACSQRGTPISYPLLGAAGYMGMLIWHGGLSGSAPLAVTTSGSFGEAIPISATVFRGTNLALLAVLLVFVPGVFAWLGTGAPNASHPALSTVETRHEQRRHEGERRRLVSRLESGLFTSLLLAVPIVTALLLALADDGIASIQLNFIILAFLAAGLLAHRSPRAYVAAFTVGATNASGILLQFPIYFGALAVTRDSGLLIDIARTFASWTDGLSAVVPLSTSAAWTTFASAALLNLLVPSGGGQWALQSPILVETATRLSLDRAPLVMAFAYGDELTNLLQPFWALPLLSITGLTAKEVFGYTLLVMTLCTPLFLVALALQ